MILAIDIGNTNIVIGFYDNKKALYTARFKTDSRKTEWEYATMIKDIFDLSAIEMPMPKNGAISCVVPALTTVMERALKILRINNIVNVGPGVKTGLNIKIDNPGELGADLCCTSVAVMERYPLPAIIIDMGTATKISVIDDKKAFRGGAISPGVTVALSALSSSTAQLPHIGLNTEIVPIGTNTIQCMTAGSVLATASMLDGMIERYSDIIGEVKTIVACGGLAKGIIPHCKTKIIIDDNLLIDGLVDIFYKNTKVEN